jgi:hypothetical protein
LVSLASAFPIPQRGGGSEGAIGYGAGATGGGGGGGTTVSSCSALSAAAANGGVIRVQGLLSGCGAIKVASKTTILGVGANSGKHSELSVGMPTLTASRSDWWRPAHQKGLECHHPQHQVRHTS